MKINIASWNIWIYGPRDFKGIAKVVKENKIDIIGIQEAGIYFDKGNQENSAEKIAKELGFNYVFYPAADTRPKENYIIGNAVLSRFPITKSLSHHLNPPGVKYIGTYETEPRILVSSKIKLGKEKILNFLTAHLQVSLRFKTTNIRLAQVQNVLSIIKKLDGPVVLTGDFNATPQNKEIKKIEKILTRLGGNKPTWTVHPFSTDGWNVNKLEYRLDNIFISKKLAHSDFKIIKSKISDHLPIKATIDI